MSRVESSGRPHSLDAGDDSSSSNQEDWVGYSEDSFVVNELEEAREKRENQWRPEADIEKEGDDEWQNIWLRLDSEDVRRNSDFSGDRNGLHDHSEIAGEAIEKYHDKIFRPKAQEDGQSVVLVQGMNYIDALADQFDRPIRSIGGNWRQMVYAAEKEEGVSDEVLMSGNPDEGYDAMVIPSGDVEERESSGSIDVDFFRKGRRVYHENHNEYLTALADLAVGRGRQTSDVIRNGELLLNNSVEVNGPVEWGEVESFEFEISNSELIDEESNMMQCEWNINANYDDKDTAEEIGEYSETFIYAEGFEDMETVQRYRGNNKSAAELYGEAFDSYSNLNFPAAILAISRGNMKATQQLFSGITSSD